MNEKGKYRSIPHPGGIVCSEVLPGFQFRSADLYAHPDLRKKLDDPVYHSFILLEYQAEHKRAEAADQRVERLAAMLRTIGIDPDTGQSER